MLKPEPRVQLVPVDQLRPHDRNPRTITRERFEALKATLLAEPELLEARPLIALPSGMVVAGNMRQRALEALFEESSDAFLRQWPGGAVPTLVRDLDDDQAARWMMLDNNPFGEWEEQALAELIFDHEQRGNDLQSLGFTPERVTQLLDSVDGRKGPNRWPDDPAPLPPRTARAKLGRVYELGPHRLMAGDATNPKHVARLLEGATPRLCVTDPPYGVELDLGWRDDEATARNREAGTASSGRRTKVDAGERGYARRTGIEGDTRADWSAALELVPSLDVIYHWTSDAKAPEVLDGLRRIGFQLAQLIVWDKMQFALSRAHYQWRHEAAAYAIRSSLETEVPWYGPVSNVAAYARRPGSRVPFLGAHDQTTIWAAPSPKRARNDRPTGDEEADHPTQKPVLLYTRPYQNHTLRGDAVYEPFSGSGTAIVAAEMTGRRCYAMELDPGFVDVAIERYRLFMEGETP